MSTSIRCTKCQTWNVDQDYCTACGHLLSYRIKAELDEQARIDQENSKIPDNTDRFLEKWKNSRFLPVRAIYYALYSVWFVLMSLVSLFIYMVAAGPG